MIMFQSASEKSHVQWVSDCGEGHNGEVMASKGEVNVIACEACGFAHIIPLPGQERLKQFYEAEFYQTEKTEYLSMDADEKSWRALEFEARYEFAERHIGRTDRSVLDVGCGPGDFLQTGQRRGWKVMGVEPSPAASKFACDQGLNVKTGFFGPEILPTLGQFDFIHMSEVLEHVADPSEVVSNASKLLRPGGVICISVPNDFNDFQDTFVKHSKGDEWWVVPDHHLNYFSFDTLEHLLVDQGLELLERTTNFPMELFLLMGLDYTVDSTLGSKLHRWRKNLDRRMAETDALRQNFYNALARANLGRLAIIFARKKDAP